MSSGNKDSARDPEKKRKQKWKIEGEEWREAVNNRKRKDIMG